MMTTPSPKSTFLARFRAFFQRLQWKLTLAYTLFTVLTIVILGAVSLLLLWYLNFYSNLLPSMIADGLLKAGPAIAPYLEQNPPDQAGLAAWLEEGIVGDSLVINIPKENAESAEDTVPAQFGRFAAVAVVDESGEIVVAAPAGTIRSRAELEAEFSPQAAAGFAAALRGETDTAALSARDGAFLLGAAPVFDSQDQVVGAIFVKSRLYIDQFEFLRSALRETILPVAGIMLVVGIITGVLFGFVIARWLTRRLRRLGTAADAWSAGNFEVLVPDSTGDELGTLARHFNHMALQVQNLLQTRQGLATLEERNRLARDLHDSVKQQVFATAMQVGAAKAILDRDPDAAREHLSEAEQLVRQAQQELTTLIQELRPVALEGRGLARALDDYATDWGRQNNIAVELRVSGERPLPLPIEQTLFRVAQEALANIARHSRAAAAELHLAWLAHGVTLTISDNGQGFNVTSPNGRGMGLQSMRERL
ncbi:MAG: HAMP domain-containing protein, partial [Anaerolineae bacterium]|nr:HAMP domain-containing protein [Anaerolineae bacterium]